EFLNSLDQKHNSKVYASFEKAFLDEEITVNVIKDLSDEQLYRLGIVKIGWQKNIKQAAQRF
ncbi:20656_t:CDS:1, partial [Funneliformis geosporum]